MTRGERSKRQPFNLYVGQFTLSTQLITQNYPDILSHRRSTTVSLETYPLYLYVLFVFCRFFATSSTSLSKSNDQRGQYHQMNNCIKKRILNVYGLLSDCLFFCKAEIDKNFAIPNFWRQSHETSIL